jgi:hypothetical protein
MGGDGMRRATTSSDLSQRMLHIYFPEGMVTVSMPVGMKALLDQYLIELHKKTGIKLKRSEFALWAIKRAIEELEAGEQKELLARAKDSLGNHEQEEKSSADQDKIEALAPLASKQGT